MYPRPGLLPWAEPTRKLLRAEGIGHRVGCRPEGESERIWLLRVNRENQAHTDDKDRQAGNAVPPHDDRHASRLVVFCFQKVLKSVHVSILFYKII
jgi:hypothetical protein